MLYTQAGDLSACKKDIQGFIGHLEHARAPPWASFLACRLGDVNSQPPTELPDPSPANPATADPPASGDPDEREWLFPRKSNQQQKEIADLLRRRHTVVVQGPPGTGKTHTLANIVSDAVAHGRRVLVVSTGQHALEALLDKLPESVASIAMFFGDGVMAQDQKQVIRAVSSARQIVMDGQRRDVTAQAAADRERLEDLVESGRAKKKRIEAELRFRAELMLLPFTKPLGAWEKGPLAEARRLREEVRGRIGAGPVKKKHLLALMMAVSQCARQAGEAEPEWLEELAARDREEVSMLLDRIVPLLPDIYGQDLYQQLEATDGTLLESTERLIGLHMRSRMVKISEDTPSVPFLANQFLEQLRSAQGKGRGHHARHWKNAREILVREHGLLMAFPLWIMTTSMVAELLPASFRLFDIVAMDEASKSEVYELPALLRGDRILVVGDNKQVSPNDNGIKDERLRELDRLREGVTASVAMRCAFEPGKSIFDLFHGMHITDVKILREHFRCAQPIIRFCNDNFYTGELEPLRVSTRAKRLVPPIKVNAQEAEGRSIQGAASEAAREEEQMRLNLLSESLWKMKSADLKCECRVSGF